MTAFNPYDILLRPVGPLTSEKVLNAQDKLPPGFLKEFRTNSRKAVKEALDEVDANEALTAAEKVLAKQKATRKILHARRATRRDLNQNQNKLVFLVRKHATKPQIKHAIEVVYNVKVIQVNTLHTKRGKRAIIKLSDKDSAQDVYNRLGQM
jgi:large subunit ribosomal protein L23